MRVKYRFSYNDYLIFVPTIFITTHIYILLRVLFTKETPDTVNFEPWLDFSLKYHTSWNHSFTNLQFYLLRFYTDHFVNVWRGLHRVKWRFDGDFLTSDWHFPDEMVPLSVQFSHGYFIFTTLKEFV